MSDNNTEIEIQNKRLMLVELEHRVSVEHSKLNAMLQGLQETSLRVSALEKIENNLNISITFLEKSIVNASNSLLRLQEHRASMSTLPTK